MDERAELKPCPFCGKSETLERCRASEVLWDEENEGPYPHTESYAVVCSAKMPDGPGGCGSSGGYFKTQREADSAWNNRASLDTQTGKVTEALELVVCEAEAQCGEPEPGCVRCDAAKLVRETFGLPPASMVDVTGEKDQGDVNAS